MSSQARIPRLELRGIHKAFADVVANDGISLRIWPGEIHALLGENGAGKSTLVSIVDGVLRADAGEILWDGSAVTIDGPKAARRLGIGMVFQHFSLFEALTVVENVALGVGARWRLPALTRRIRELSEAYGLAVEPSAPVHDLAMGERQRVEILRCLVEDARLLILDEPTSVLTPQEAEGLFQVLRRLAREDTAIVFISHKLDEVRALCDTATVLRRGRVVAECRPADESAKSLARLMVGEELPAQRRPRAAPAGDVLLQVQGLSMRSPARFGTDLADVHLGVRAGEILGIAGVAGNGQQELTAALSGERTCDRDDAIVIAGRPAGRLGPRARRRLGLACIPEDRLGHGAVPSMMLAENAFLSGFEPKALTRLGLVRSRARDEYAASIVAQFDVRARGVRTPAEVLSGGNLQKFITGRELLQSPAVLVAAHPTSGVDAGAAAAIHGALLRLADAGAGVVLISNELDELLGLCDRVAVMFRGRLSAPQPVGQVTPDALGLLMAGGGEGHGDRIRVA